MSELARQLESNSEFANALNAIQQPRTAYVLQKFVVGQHDAPGQQWAQCVLEMQQKITALATAQIDREIVEIQIANLQKRETPVAILKAKKKRIELQQLEWAELGAARELTDLKAIYDSFGRTWTREELECEQVEYWQRRLTRQANQDMIAHGRVMVGNQDALRQIGMPVAPPVDAIRQVENRFLECGKIRILIAVPTLIERATIERDGLRCLDGWDLPGTVEQRVYVVDGRPVADAYIDAAHKAIADNADFMLCVEDDHLIPSGTFERLYDVWQKSGPKTIVSAWYPQRKEPRTGTPIIIRDGTRDYLDDDGLIHEVYGIPQGFTLIPTAVFHEIPQPWFATTGSMTQDSYFSQLAREAGYKLLVDTSCRIKHVCRETGRVYQ